MTAAQRIRLICILLIALAGIVACVLFAAIASAQCMCPAPSEPPVVWVGLPSVQPGGGYVFLAWVKP